jgi:acyl-homoserine lactone acylase PvdQ
MKFRLSKALAKFAVALVVVAAAAGFYLFYLATPAYSGAAALPGLTAETRVWRDAYAAPDPDKSRFIIATGESGHIFSPHYRNLAALWIDGKSIALTGGEDELRRAGAQEFVFTPQ